MKCVGCGHLFAGDVAPGAGVQSVDDPGAVEAAYEGRNGRLVKRLLRDRVLFNGAQVLDFGAGVGHLSIAIRDRVRGSEVQCIEADGAAAARLRSLGFKTWRGIEDPPSEFDLLMLVEVIEHLDDPVHTLTALRAKMTTDGTLFITTPCGETSRGSRKTNAYDTKEHVQFFTERSLATAVKAAGFADFQFMVINEMHPRAGVRSYMKDLLRPLRAALLGHQHLTGYARAVK
jgi:cyclopropane fatty-acyl-phospholipid synthase-like methyltransferase